jgi:hypothetical protein
MRGPVHRQEERDVAAIYRASDLTVGLAPSAGVSSGERGRDPSTAAWDLPAGQQGA